MTDGSPPLTGDRWRAIESIFHAAIERPPQERAGFVRARCGHDSLLFSEVQQVLAAFETLDGANLPALKSETTRGGDLLGEYRIEKEIAHGGMGTVYLAHRADGQFEQRVALKVVSPHLRNEFFAERFLTERQILAQLNHPHITRLLDGGVSAEGETYLVMEYVDGSPIHHYCDSHLLAIPDRVRLFLDVCDAVAYAHQNLVIHCDLKPGNIFVTGEGIPKLLDFGTAKLLSLASADLATTRLGLLTPRYASPEHLLGDKVTTLTDVYSLGVVLFELLVGAWPFGDPESPIAGIERAVRHVEPARPAALVTGEVARLRSETPARLGRLLDGDLHSILRKACEPDPRDRYSSVEQFSEDLRRYLSGRPVLARSQTLVYRASRFARRNRWPLATGALLCAVLALMGMSALQQYGRNQRRMVQVRNLSQSYLTDVLNEVGKLPGSLNARVLIVDRARRNLDELLPDAPADPELRRALALAYLKLGDIQGRPFTVSLGDAEGAVVSYRKAEALAEKGGPKDWELVAVLVRTRVNIATIEGRAGRYSEAMALVQSTLEPARRLWKQGPPGLELDGNPAATLAVDANLRLGYVMLAASNPAPSAELGERCVAQFRQTVAIAEEVQNVWPGPKDLAAVPSQYLGFALMRLGDLTGDRRDYQEAVVAHRRAVEGICKLEVSQPSPQTVRNCGDGYSELSWALHHAGEGEAGIRAAREALARMEPIARAEPDSAEALADVTEAYYHLGAAEEIAGKLHDAIADLRIAEELVRPRQSPAGYLLGTANAYVDVERYLAKVLTETHDYAGAMKALENGLSAAEGRFTIDARAREDLARQMEQVRALLLDRKQSPTGQ